MEPNRISESLSVIQNLTDSLAQDESKDWLKEVIANELDNLIRFINNPVVN